MKEETYKELKRFEKRLDDLIKDELHSIPAEDVEHFFQDISMVAYLMIVLEEAKVGNSKR